MSPLEDMGKQNSPFLMMPVIKGLFYLLIQKYGTKCKKNHLLDVKLPWFQGSQPDHVQTEYSGCCFCSELSRFCSPCTEF